MKKSLLILLIVLSVFAVSVLGYSIVKNGSIYTITLDSGLKFNATNVSYNSATKTLNASILAKNLSIKQVVEIDKAIQNFTDSTTGKKNYSVNVFYIKG